MYKYSKLTLKIFIIINVLLLGYFCLAAYIYDPLQIWHKPYFRELTYGDNNRETNKAIIRDNNFDSIIIGNSLSTNVSAKEASKKLHSVFINLSMDGAPPPENKIILDYTLKQKKIKKVIYFLTISYSNLIKENPTYPVTKYSFLYDNNKYNDYQIYLNDKYLKCIIKLSKTPKCIGTVLNIDKPYAWDTKKEYINRLGGFNNWVKYKDNKQIKDIFDSILKIPDKICNQDISNQQKIEIRDYLDKNVINIIKMNPKIQFYLVIPPSSSLELAIEIRSKRELNFARQKFALRYLVSENEKYNNLKIFAFNNLNNIGDVENFKDLTHFHPEINSYILDSIKKNKHIINSQNVDEYITRIYKKAVFYNYNYYFNLIKNI